MTIISAILSIVATIMPFLIESIRKKSTIRNKPISRIQKLKGFQDEKDIEIAWAEHDAAIQRLLDSMPIFKDKENESSDSD